MYGLEQWSNGSWHSVRGALTLTHAAKMLFEADVEGAVVPRRVVDEQRRTIFAGRHCPRDTPVNTIHPFWIVMSLDKPGPCERDGEPYHRHETKAAALAEARRLSSACGGGRFGVLALEHVTGWVDFEFDLDDRIPF